MDAHMTGCIAHLDTEGELAERRGSDGGGESACEARERARGELAHDLLGVLADVLLDPYG